ncbi:hypothetical protein [Marinomonas spartinae]|uniref:hypothetical protein n=1 Tax=Marinomonas spartinae TaxID=1792290 RepID=UPI0018F240D6|nr:hypothetical protein [Marinomonas spartinae]MBJ7556678.1 hypothetical protein [Marinomonas spartinae]
MFIDSFKKLSVIIGVLLAFFSYEIKAESYHSGNYPRFSNAILWPSGESVSAKPSNVSRAIEKATMIPLAYTSNIKDMEQYLFPKSVYGGLYMQNKLASHGFVQVLSNVVKQFGCAEYRFRHDLPKSTGCQNGSSSHKEAMPFVSGQFTTKRIESVADDKHSGVSFYAYLKSTDEKSLKSAFGSVHELGTFFGKAPDRHSLVLSVDLQAFQLNSNMFRGKKINQYAYTYFLILPKAIDIARQANQEAAGAFSVKHARLVVLGK